MTGWFAWVGPVADAIGKGLEWLGVRERRKERADAEETGARKQRLADAEEEREQTREQLEEAVNRRPGDARRRLDRGTF